jgi:hypothetical protein
MKKLLFLLPLMVVVFGCATAPAPSAPEEAGPAAPAAPPAPAAPLATAARNKALAAMEAAKSIKADVAVKDVYNTALTAFNEGEALGSSAPGADGKYLEAERGFTAAYNRAQELRSAAQNELTKARQDIKTAEDEAAEMEASLAEETGE